MNIDQPTIFLLVGLTVAIVEGVKQVVEGFGQELNPGAKVAITVAIGMGLAAFYEFAPEAWERFLPILIVGLVAAGVYSLGKRGGAAVITRFAPTQPPVTNVTFALEEVPVDDDAAEELADTFANLW